MKKILFTLLITLSAAALLMGCSKYKEGVDIPEGYPEEIEVYDDAVVFEALEENNTITLSTGTDKSVIEAAEFYQELVSGKAFILDKHEKSFEEYVAQGRGSYYDFSVRAVEAKGMDGIYFDTIITVVIEQSDQRRELMENMQGLWLFTGAGGLVSEEMQSRGQYFAIDGNAYEYYAGFEKQETESYVFFLEDNSIIIKDRTGQQRVYGTASETVGSVEVMTLNNAEHYISINDSEIEEYKKLSEVYQTYIKMQGFWQRVGIDGTIDDMYKGFAYNFSEYQLDVFFNLETAQENITYTFVDADTIMYEFFGDTYTVDVVFGYVDGVDVMTLVSEEGSMQFESMEYADYRMKIGMALGSPMMEEIQGLWQMVGADGEIIESYKDAGAAYDFRENHFHIYNQHVMTDSNIVFYFIDEDSIEWVADLGQIVSADISFEVIDGLSVMTYSADGIDYHYISVSYAEFMGIHTTSDGEAVKQLEGFWHVVGVNGYIPEEYYSYGYAFEFTENTMTSYRGYEVHYDKVEYRKNDLNGITFYAPDSTFGVSLNLESVEGADVLTITIAAVNYHCIQSTHDDFMAGKP